MNRWFDGAAGATAEVVSRAPFFVFCVISILIWLPSFPVFESAESWQLPINTFTTVVTFLLVALLQNTQRRTEMAINRKLDAIADALADLMHQTSEATGHSIERDIAELRASVGIEMADSDESRARVRSAARAARAERED